jgi:hypothetical protein
MAEFCMIFLASICTFLYTVCVHFSQGCNTPPSLTCIFFLVCSHIKFCSIGNIRCYVHHNLQEMPHFTSAVRGLRLELYLYLCLSMLFSHCMDRSWNNNIGKLSLTCYLHCGRPWQNILPKIELKIIVLTWMFAMPNVKQKSPNSMSQS